MVRQATHLKKAVLLFFSTNCPAPSGGRALTNPANAKITLINEEPGTIFASCVIFTCSLRSLTFRQAPLPASLLPWLAGFLIPLAVCWLCRHSGPAPGGVSLPKNGGTPKTGVPPKGMEAANPQEPAAALTPAPQALPPEMRRNPGRRRSRHAQKWARRGRY